IDGPSQNGPRRSREIPLSASGGGGSNCCAETGVVTISSASAAAGPIIFTWVTSRALRSGLSLRPPLARDFQRTYLPVQVRALDAERLRRLADPSLVLLEDGRNVLALEPRSR